MHRLPVLGVLAWLVAASQVSLPFAESLAYLKIRCEKNYV
jgi:hypothetical protein